MWALSLPWWPAAQCLFLDRQGGGLTVSPGLCSSFLDHWEDYTVLTHSCSQCLAQGHFETWWGGVGIELATLRLLNYSSTSWTTIALYVHNNAHQTPFHLKLFRLLKTSFILLNNINYFSYKLLVVFLVVFVMISMMSIVKWPLMTVSFRSVVMSWE